MISPSTFRVGRVILGVILLAPDPTPVFGQAVHFADVYSSPSEIKKPSSLTLLKKEGEGWKWQLDGAAWLHGGVGSLLYDVGVSAALGSARKDEARVITPVLALNGVAAEAYVDVGYSFESTTDSDYRNSVVGLKVSPLEWRRAAIGIPVGSNPQFRWRPHIGIQAAHVHAAATSFEAPVGDQALRVVASIEAMLDVRTGRDSSRTLFEVGVKSTGRYLATTEQYRGDLGAVIAVPVLDPRLWVQLRYELARRPPTYVRDETVTLAFGVRR